MQNMSYKEKLKAEKHDRIQLETSLIKEDLVYTLLIFRILKLDNEVSQGKQDTQIPME